MIIDKKTFSQIKIDPFAQEEILTDMKRFSLIKVSAGIVRDSLTYKKRFWQIKRFSQTKISADNISECNKENGAKFSGK